MSTVILAQSVLTIISARTKMLTTDSAINTYTYSESIVYFQLTPVADAPDIFSVGHVHVIYGDFHTFSSRGLSWIAHPLSVTAMDP